MSRRVFRLPWRTARTIRADLDAELELHIALRADELEKGGMSAAAARAEAEREFGDMEFTRRYCEALDRSGDRASRHVEWLSELWSDLRWSVRGIRHRPGYTTLVAITLALGVGANTAVFSVINSVLLHDSPFPDPSRLITVDELNVPSATAFSDVAAAEYLDWTGATGSLVGIAAAGQRSLTFSEGKTPEQIPGRRVTANFFEVLGVKPALGRTFLPGEDRGVNRVIVLSDGLWRRMFGADPSIIGKQIRLSGDAYTVVGVLRPDFIFPRALPQFFVPVDLTAAMNDATRARKFHFLHAYARLRPTASVDDARAELQTIARRAEKSHPDESTGHLVSVRPLRDAEFGEFAPTLLVLAGAAAFVLLIACANVANLALGRALARRREIAVRIALGAGRGRIIRQVLTESVLLALIGGGIGFAVARVATPGLLSLYPRALPPGYPVSVDTSVLMFALVITGATAVGFGAGPAIFSGREVGGSTLRDGARGATFGRTSARARRVLVVAQMTLAMVLLIGAGLLVRTLANVHSIDLGFDAARLETVTISLPRARYQADDKVVVFWNTLLERVKQAPGMSNSSLAGAAPLLGGSGASLVIQGRETSGPPPEVRYGVASAGFFHTIGVPVRAGRDFSPSDRGASTPVVVINEAAVRKFWPNTNPIGANVRLGPDPSVPWAKVIGVVGDFRAEMIDMPALPTAYTFADQDVWSSMTLIMRTTRAPNDTRALVADIVRELDPELAVQNVVVLRDIVTAASAPRRFALTLLGVFALVALALAIVGLYGVISYGVLARRQEFGVRAALGATPALLVRAVVSEGLGVAAVGLVLGITAAAMLTRFLSGMLFGVRPLDVATFAAVSAVLLSAAIAASWLPARRAASVDPSRALRSD